MKKTKHTDNEKVKAVQKVESGITAASSQPPNSLQRSVILVSNEFTTTTSAGDSGAIKRSRCAEFPLFS